MIACFWAGTAFFSAIDQSLTAFRRAVKRLSTAIDEKVFSTEALVDEAIATWSAVMFGFALSWDRTRSYSMPSMFTNSWDAASAVAWPFQRLMISIWAMLQAS